LNPIAKNSISGSRNQAVWVIPSYRSFLNIVVGNDCLAHAQAAIRHQNIIAKSCMAILVVFDVN
jgi:hypothetical protein